MAGQTTTDRDSLQPLLDRLDKQDEQIRILQRPTGTSLAGLLAQVQAAIVGIGAAVTAFLAGGFTTGNMTATGRVTANGGLTSADVKSRTLSFGYDAVYIGDGGAILGKSPSALRFKQDLEPFTFDPGLVDGMQGYTFRLIGAVEAMGDDAPREHGYIADYLDEVGLGAFARHDEDGQFSGLAYERLVLVAIDSLKDARARIKILEERLDASGL